MNIPKLQKLYYTKPVQSWLQQRTGQIFLNYVYNIGAAIVILGALFKLTHLPGANPILLVGMGTEVIIFVISAFDISSVDLNDITTDSAAGNNKSYHGGSNTVNLNASHPQIDENIAAVCDAYKYYETQIRNAASNVKSLDSETKKMTENMEKINDVYGRIIGDLKVK